MKKSKPTSHYLPISRRFARFLNAIKRIKKDDYGEWQVVVIFYSALHLINHYARWADRQTFDNHRERRSYVNSKKPLRPVRKHYEALFQASMGARYYGRRFEAEHVRDYAQYLEVIESHIRKLIGYLPQIL